MRPFSLARVVLFVVALGMRLGAVVQKEPADDTFQQGIVKFQAGDKAAAVKLFMAAARAGNSKANVQMGWCYEFGEGVRQDLSLAAQLYRVGAELGNSRGQKNLGSL